MARKCRSIRTLSFTDGHQLGRDLVEIGLGDVPSTDEIRSLMELGIAARRAGFMCVRAGDRKLTLVQTITGLDEKPRTSSILPTSGSREITTGESSAPPPQVIRESPPDHVPDNSRDERHEIGIQVLKDASSLPLGSSVVLPSESASQLLETAEDRAEGEESEGVSEESRLFDQQTGDLLMKAMML